jgi:hypothetical protein
MKPKTAALMLAMMAAFVGCSLNRPDMKREAWVTRLGGGGQVIEPKRCALTLAILTRPMSDEALNSALWRVADEQAISPEARQALEGNGLRVGLISGELPTEVESVLKAPPPHKIDPMQVVMPSGEHTLVTLSEPTSQISLLLSRDGRAMGKDYKDASGFIRVTASHTGPKGVNIRLVPEIHHGPIQRNFGAVPTGAGLATHQFIQKDGQQEETLRELAATLVLEPGQVAVVGAQPDRPRSLGAFLFTQAEVNSDRMLQKVLLIWASRTNLGIPTGEGKTVPPHLEPIDPPAEANFRPLSKAEAASRAKDEEKDEK